MSADPHPTPEPQMPLSGSIGPNSWVKRVFRWERLDSTNEAAFRALEQGIARDGDAFVSLEQAQGRGRRGKQWCSEPGQGLYVSFVLCPGEPWPGPLITIAAGLATRDAVQSLGLAKTHLKWPNDLLSGPSKLAGILVESRAWSPDNPIYVVGIGVNVGQLHFPADLEAERPVASLAQLGLTCTLGEVESALFAHLGRRLQQARMAPAVLARNFIEALEFGTSQVEVRLSAETITGPILSLDFERGLEISMGQGRKRWTALEHIRSVSLAPPPPH